MWFISFQRAINQSSVSHIDSPLSSVIEGDVLVAGVRVQHSRCLLVEWLRVPNRLIDVIGAPGAVLRVTRDRSKQAPNALIDIQLE